MHSVTNINLSNLQDSLGVEEAVDLLVKAGSKQPLLFSLGGEYYVKLDRQALHISSATCMCDAVQFLLMVFFVFNLKYPQELQMVFTFLEGRMGLPKTGRSVIISEFDKKLKL